MHETAAHISQYHTGTDSSIASNRIQPSHHIVVALIVSAAADISSAHNHMTRRRLSSLSLNGDITHSFIHQQHQHSPTYYAATYESACYHSTDY